MKRRWRFTYEGIGKVVSSITMKKTTAARDQERRILRVVDHIFAHPDQDLSRPTLGRVAHYSPEHLPKLFKQFTGETPKQFSAHLRLETAFHRLIIHPGEPIAAIGVECGFSSLSTFSRAMKTYFRFSPEEIRRLPHSQQMRLLHHSSAPSPMSAVQIASGVPPVSTIARLTPPPGISIVRQAAIQGIYLPAPFNAPEKITQAFETLNGFSGNDKATALKGILMPHLRNTYRAFLTLSPEQFSGLPYPATRIEAGTYARFTVTGDLRTSNKAAHHFYRSWLPASGYRISGIAGFETFDQDPANYPYPELQRHIHIPIEPAR